MKMTRFLITALILAGAGFTCGHLIPEMISSKAIDHPQVSVQSTQALHVPQLKSDAALNETQTAFDDSLAAEAVIELCRNQRLEKALQAYEILPLEERQAAAFNLGKCGAALDLLRIRSLATMTEDVTERRALYRGIFSSWSHFAADEASKAVAELPDGLEKRFQGAALGRALIGVNPSAGAKWLFTSDFDTEEDDDLRTAARVFGRDNYGEVMKLLEETPFAPERRLTLAKEARVSWNQNCVIHGEWAKIIPPSAP